jgi:hypothetical protein
MMGLEEFTLIYRGGLNHPDSSSNCKDLIHEYVRLTYSILYKSNAAIVHSWRVHYYSGTNLIPF